ncbi:hypothetical protein F0562_010829 [Nyssa sinensis]|uniref:Uncharacterized protein n=1 Tax=Nyssa sinensis TaxID=561372 RepID=A0A5J5A1P6_9ASTE|nr:hypothetical protein F0562_010829 [Nyssa sinensis]
MEEKVVIENYRVLKCNYKITNIGKDNFDDVSEDLEDQSTVKEGSKVEDEVRDTLNKKEDEGAVDEVFHGEVESRMAIGMVQSDEGVSLVVLFCGVVVAIGWFIGV